MELRPFATLDEYWAAVTAFIAQLEREGHGDAAAGLRYGYGCLNGLTDGWARFLEAIERAQARHGVELTRDERRRLEEIRGVASGVVKGRRG